MKFGPNAPVSKIDFRPKWRLSLRFSATLFAISVALLLFKGLNLSIEFEGGGLWEVPVTEDVTVADGRDAIDGILDDARVQTVVDNNDQTLIRVQSAETSDEISAEVVDALEGLAIDSSSEVQGRTVGASWGERITGKAIQALAAFFVLVAIYLAWRLEWQMAVGGLVAVAHDLVITAGLYSLFGFEVSPATVIALLTILGYSLYDTVVVYDKVLENQNDPNVNYQGPTGTINQSMNEVLARSINTTITTVLPVLSMLIVGVVFLGGSALLDFALALFIGLLLGTYSSVFVAAPLLAWMKERDLDQNARLLFKDEPLNSGDFVAIASESKPRPGQKLHDRPSTGAKTETKPRPRKKRRKKR